MVFRCCLIPSTPAGAAYLVKWTTVSKQQMFLVLILLDEQRKQRYKESSRVHLFQYYLNAWRKKEFIPIVFQSAVRVGDAICKSLLVIMRSKCIKPNPGCIFVGHCVYKFPIQGCILMTKSIKSRHTLQLMLLVCWLWKFLHTYCTKESHCKDGKWSNIFPFLYLLF